MISRVPLDMSILHPGKIISYVSLFAHMYEPIHAPVGGLADFPLIFSICVNAERSGNTYLVGRPVPRLIVAGNDRTRSTLTSSFAQHL